MKKSININNTVLNFDYDSSTVKGMGINVLTSLAEWVRDGYPDCYDKISEAVFELMFDLPWDTPDYTIAKKSLTTHEHFGVIMGAFHKKFGYSIQGYLMYGSSEIHVDGEIFAGLPAILEDFMVYGIDLRYNKEKSKPSDGLMTYDVMQEGNTTDMHLDVDATDGKMKVFVTNDWDSKKMEVKEDHGDVMQNVESTLSHSVSKR